MTFGDAVEEIERRYRRVKERDQGTLFDMGLKQAYKDVLGVLEQVDGR
jgi:hypothetical protein